MTPRPPLFEKSTLSESLFECVDHGLGEDMQTMTSARTNDDTYWRPAHAAYDLSSDGTDAGESAVIVIDDFLLGRT